MWEKEKLLITSNFSFFHSVFKRLVLQTQKKKQDLFGKGLTLYLICQSWGSFNSTAKKKKIGCQKYGQIWIQLSDLVENIVGKEEIASYEQFLLFPQCFQKASVVDASK